MQVSAKKDCWEESEMEKTIIKTEVEIVLTDQDIDDIVACAFDGGITYWCDEVKVIGDYLGECASDQISRGGKVKLYDFEGEEEHILTKEKFIEGFKLYCKTMAIGEITENVNGELKVNTCQVDAEIADEIIQFALFEDVIYG